MIDQPHSLDIRHISGMADYERTTSEMEHLVGNIIASKAREALWFLEFPPLFTAGTGADTNLEIIGDSGFPVYPTGRGGKTTYHGPGQRIVYTMLDLGRRDMKDIRRYIHMLESWIIDTLHHLDIAAERREGRVGIWYTDATTGYEHKIAAIGIRIRKWVTFHGIALNVHPDLSHYRHIIPCGISGHGITSVHALGKNVSMQDVDHALLESFHRTFDGRSTSLTCVH